MTVSELLSELRARGIALRVEGDRLKSVGQHGSVTPELGARIRHHKADLIRILSEAGESTTAANDTIPRAADQASYGLSVTQARAAETARQGNFLPTAFRLRGPLDRDVLCTTLQHIVERHSPLHTVFALDSDPPMQHVVEVPRVELPLIELRTDDREAELSRTLEELRRRRFDTSRLPLYSFELIALGPTEHVLFAAFSPMVFDGWSFDVFWNELRLGYAALIKGAAWPFAEPEVTYADFVSWQRTRLEEHDLRLAAFWRNRLGEELPKLPLPTDFPRGKSTSGKGTSRKFDLPENTVTTLRNFAKTAGCTPQLVMLAALYALLGRIGGQRRAIVGSPVEARNHSSFESLIGPFVNMLLLPQDIDLGRPFNEFVVSVRDDALAAYQHQEYPIERLHVRSAPSNVGGLAPAFQVELSFQQVSNRGSHMGPLTLTQIELESGAATNDWTIWVKDWGDRIAGAVEFKTDLFETATIDHWSRCFVGYLQALMDAPTTPMYAVDVLGAERAAAEQAMNAVHRAPPSWLLETLKRHPDAGLAGARVVDARGQQVVLGAFGTLELARTEGVNGAAAVSGFVSTGQRVRLRASGSLDQPEQGRVAPAGRKSNAQPQSDLEKKMVAIFAEVLRLPEVGLDDNYFDLGGNSLLALSLFKRIQEVCGIRLPQASLLEAGTPRQLAKTASELFSKGRDECLVVLREGTTDKTVFFVHDGDGETLLYLNLARRLRPEFRVIGIHPQRRGALPMVHTTVEDAARHYVSEMKRVAPHGPYRIGGLCAGGVIAFAIAAELEARGDQVELLILGEAAPMHAERRLTSGERRVGSAKVLLRRGLSGDFLPALRAAARSAWNTGNYETRRLTKLAGWYATCRAIPLLEKSQLDWPQALPAPAVRDIWQFAEVAYAPSKLQRTTPVVVRATRSDGTSGDAPLKDLLVDPSFGWQRVAALPVKTVDVAGGHSSMWQEPHVQDLASRINELLG